MAQTQSRRTSLSPKICHYAAKRHGSRDKNDQTHLNGWFSGFSTRSAPEIMSALQTTSTRKGIATYVSSGQTIDVMYTHGDHVVHIRGLSHPNIRESLSMKHIRPHIVPHAKRRRQDVHQRSSSDSNAFRGYREKHKIQPLRHTIGTNINLSGWTDYQDAYTDNLAIAMSEWALEVSEVLNCLMNIPAREDHSLSLRCRFRCQGASFSFTAEMDFIIVFSQLVRRISRHQPSRSFPDRSTLHSTIGKLCIFLTL